MLYVPQIVIHRPHETENIVLTYLALPVEAARFIGASMSLSPQATAASQKVCLHSPYYLYFLDDVKTSVETIELSSQHSHV